jgi:hypothetical protein
MRNSKSKAPAISGFRIYTPQAASACLFVLVLLLALAAKAQPANDNFANRTVLAGGKAVVGDSLAGATTEAGEPFLPGISSGQTAWWTWNAPSNGIVSLSVSATNFSPLLTVYTGSDLPSLSLMASNNYLACYSDGECGCHWRERSQIALHVARGQTYPIAVDSAIITDASMEIQSEPVGDGVLMLSSWRPSFTTNVLIGGSYQLGLEFTPAPANDDFEHAVKLSGSRLHIAASNAGATKQTGEPNHLGNPGGSSVWYSWTAPASGRVTLSTNNVPPYQPPSSTGGSGSIDWWMNPMPTCGDLTDQTPPPQFYPLLAAYTGTAVDTLSPANCMPMGLDAYPNAVEFDALKGQTYKIAVDGNMGTTGGITLYLALTKPASNDDFKKRIKLHGINVAATGYNAGATREAGEPLIPGSLGKSVWWSWTAPVSGTVSLDLAGSDYSFPVAFFVGTVVSNLSMVAAGAGGVTFEAVEGQTYRIAVEDSYGLTGEVKFSLHAPVVELPLVAARGLDSSFTLLRYRASPRQVVLLQYSTDGSNWKNVRIATAQRNSVDFFVGVNLNARHPSYRAIVVDYSAE